MRYSVILADAPWRYGAGFRATGGVNHHYQTMTTREIAAIPLARVADDPCALFMWAVSPRLPDALEVMRAWGFEYVTVAFLWSKLSRRGWKHYSGLGRYTNSSVEMVLLGRRGALEGKRLAKNVKQLIEEPVGRHSQKPEGVQDRIERLFDGPYLELFARRVRPGWDCWGLEIDGRDIRDMLATREEAV